MTNKYSITLISFLLIVITLPVSAEELLQDTLIGRVQVRSDMRLDASSRKAIAAAASKIKKAKPGTVKLLGSYKPAATENEYLTKSAFVAREVAQYLKKLLPVKQQIYILFSPYSDENRGKAVVVDILLYPKLLKETNVEIINANTLQGKPAARVAPQIPMEEHTVVKPSPVQVDESPSVTYGTPKQEEPAEDYMRANEMVRRAKERAAERARRMKDAD